MDEASKVPSFLGDRCSHSNERIIMNIKEQHRTWPGCEGGDRNDVQGGHGT